MKVLVAIDNGPSSQAIFDALVKMHWSEGTELCLVTASLPDSENAGAHEPNVQVEELENIAIELRNMLRHCEISFFARTGDPKSVILDLANQVKAELIIVGSNCKSTLERLLLGSVSQSIVSGANCPVIVAKTPCCLAREASPAFKNILIAVDNSYYSDMAVQWLANFHWAEDTRFIVVAVVAEDTDLDHVHQSLQRRATSLSKFIRTRNIVVEIATGEPQQSIVNLSKKHYADLIVMGSHGHSGIKEKLLGTVSDGVSQSAPCAVAVLRAPAGREKPKRPASYARAKTTPVQKPANIDARGFRRDDRNDISVHSMPAGF